MARQQKDFTYDHDLRLKDAGAITASAAAQVGGTDKILDLGAARTDGRVILDITALDVASTNEVYRLVVQGSNSATFANTIVNLGAQIMGDSSVSLESVDSVIGRREIHFSSEQNGVTYRYVRMYTEVGGTTPSINYVANLVVQRG